MPGRTPGTMPPVMRTTSVLGDSVVVLGSGLSVQDSMSGLGGPPRSLQVLLGDLKQEHVLSWARVNEAKDRIVFDGT